MQLKIKELLLVVSIYQSLIGHNFPIFTDKIPKEYCHDWAMVTKDTLSQLLVMKMGWIKMETKQFKNIFVSKIHGVLILGKKAILKLVSILISNLLMFFLE